MSRESAAPAPGVTGETANATGQSNAAETTTAIPETAAADILRYASVPEEVVKALQAEGKEPRKSPASGTHAADEQPKAEEEQPELPEQPDEEVKEPEAEAGTEEEEAVETDEGPAEDETAEPEEVEKPGWYKQRVSKWTRQKQRLQDEIDDLKEQIAGKAKSAEQPLDKLGTGRSDPLGQVTNFQELEKLVDGQRAVRDWCMDNPDGMVIAEGTPNEKVITPEEVRKTLIGATRIIEDAPKREKELQQEAQDQHTRAQWHQIASMEWPELFDKESEIYKTSQQFLQQYPEIDRNPNRDFLLGLMVEGWKPFQQRMIARQQANGQAAPANNGAEKKESLPEALKRKIPPIPKNAAPNPPRGSRRKSPQDEAAAAVQRLAREGGSPEAAQAAIAAIERQNAMSGDTKRMPAPV